MSLDSGTRFGPYEIADEIGAGGMGVVYRATDTKLKRDVAIKVLPETLATDAERLTRFRREAEVLAALNHPNIAQIYGIEESNGTTALVLELVEGPTLADRIENGALPADEALGIAMQIAEALEAAHGQGIVHRDLKPANVKLRLDGTVKVLDFGIAKALEPENLVSGPQSPIVTTPATQAGVILGTAAYMSPEQAKGKPIDQRTDVWAFGCVLYEMLTGQMVFGAEDVPTTLARVIANEADIESLPVAISPAARQTIALCLQKDPRKRIRDIGDVRLALEGAFETTSNQGATAASTPMWRRAIPAATALVVGGVVVGLASVLLRPAPEPLPVNRFDYELPAGREFRTPSRRLLALSPTGRHFAYTAQDGLYLRTMDALEARWISGTDQNVRIPTFSPDGEAIAYFEVTTQQLKRISISGGAPVVIADVPQNGSGPSWETDGTILFSSFDGIMRVPATGGTPEVIIPLPDNKFVYGPQLLPDGDSVLYSTFLAGNQDDGEIVIHSLSSGEETVLIEGGSDARYMPSGHIVYALGDGLFGISFDLDTLTVSGGSVPLVQGVMRAVSTSTASANFGVSDNGTLVYVPGVAANENRTLAWVDREGREEPLAAPPRTYTYPRISPDGTRVALDVRDQERDIWIWDLARENLIRLTFDPAEDEFPVWSPDGRRIAYSLQGVSGAGSSIAEGNLQLLWRQADGTGAAEQLLLGGQIFPEAFLPDGTGIIIRTGDSVSDDISLFPIESEDGPIPLLNTGYNELNAEISPDGEWLAYTSNESGNYEIYVRTFPDVGGGRWQVSTGGGYHPAWRRDGEELYYRVGEAIMAVSIETDPTFEASTPEILFEGPYWAAAGGRTYDVAPDGRFLMIKRDPGEIRTQQIIIVENWLEELRRLVPHSE